MDQKIYGFMLDSAAVNKAKLDIGNAYDQGIGVLLGEPANYLVNKAYLKDTRVARLEISTGVRLAGTLEIVYDANRVETPAVANLTTEQQAAVFNILERCYTKGTMTDEQVENSLTTDNLYDGYVAGSYSRSAEVERVDEVATTVGTAIANFRINSWFEFAIRTSENTLTFKIWISNQAFARQYPYVTITNVIPPYDLNKLTDPATFSKLGNLTVLEAGSSYIFNKTNLELVGRDQNGIHLFNTKYVIDTRTHIYIPFALPYCGAKVPSSLDSRRAIREYLESNTALSDEELSIIFPEIYIDNRFYLIPIYDEYTERAGKDFYASVWQPADLVERAHRLYNDVDSDFVDASLEILTNAQNKMITLAMPDPNNSSLFSIRSTFPTYQDYATTDAGFRYMDGDAQEFGAKLARAMAIVNGMASSNEFTTTESGDLSYIVFSQGDAEYLVMDRDSFNVLVEGL
jgi:hypothetical protein